MTPAYRQRIADSKALADENMRNAAMEHGHKGTDELVRIVREKHGIPMNSDYAAELVRLYHPECKT